MSISQLQDWVGTVNIAEDFDNDEGKQTLKALGQRVKEQYDRDLGTMDDWMEAVENGIDLMKQEFEGKSTPWQDASNYKDPLLTQASIQFGDKATLELLRSKDLVSSEIIGRDPEGQKKAVSERIAEAMNYQVNHDMNDWRGTQEKLFYVLPNTGTVFKNTVHDPVEDQTESHLIQYPDFVVNQACKSMEECRSFSLVLDVSRNDLEVKVRSGRWLDVDIYPEVKGEDKKGDEHSNEDQDVIDSMDNDQKFIEQQCFFDLDDDGYEEPYIVTIHEASVKVVRIVARYDEESIKVNLNDRILSLPEALQIRMQEEKDEFGGDEAMALVGITGIESVDIDKMELLKIVPFQNITKYGFIPAPDGTFLDLGYSHLLGAIVQAINSTTNQLTDRGTLNNLGGGFLSREFRKTMGLSRLKQGQYIKTEVPADKFQKGILQNPIGEPSQTLMALNDKMQIRGQQFLSIADASGQISANTAPTTALAIIQEGMIPTSALFKRIIKATSHEFQVLFRIDQRTFDQETYAMILDDPNANVEQDFNSEGMDIVPTANAEMSSKMQRIQVAQIMMEGRQAILEAGGNPIPVVENWLESIGSDIIDQIFPEKDPEDPRLAKMREAQEMANQIESKKLELATVQTELLREEQDRLNSETGSKIRKTIADIEEIKTKMGKNIASTLLDLEKAESEQVKNQISVYTTNAQTQLAELDRQIAVLQAIGEENGRLAQTSVIPPTPGNIQRTIQ